MEVLCWHQRWTPLHPGIHGLRGAFSRGQSRRPARPGGDCRGQSSRPAWPGGDCRGQSRRPARPRANQAFLSPGLFSGELPECTQELMIDVTKSYYQKFLPLTQV